jgi:hypothetical protein
MNNEGANFSNDDRLDALLKKNAVKPSADFTASTLARIHAAGEVTDELIDRMLEGRPVAAKADFTARTLERISRRTAIVSFFRPALAAAASVAISLTGIWVYENAGASDTNGETVAAAAPAVEIDEIKELAAALNDAAPLLDPRAADTLAMVSSEQ